MVEFKTAHVQSLEDKFNRLIIIKTGDLPKKFDPAIQAHLNSTTYLIWGETDFWKKLLYVLPTTNGERNQFKEV